MAELRIAATSGQETLLDDPAVQELKSRVNGPLVAPGDEGYDEARRVWNGMIDRRPALIIRCTSAADVVEAVRFARRHDILASVRGGDHSLAGHCVCERGLMIDLSLMKKVRVDPSTQTARVEGGAKWRDVDRETQAFGLATTGGTNSDTGVAGLTLGGGLGWLAGKYGLACDNLLSADMATADGRLLTASRAQHEDLFWGLRGGSGNFGIATSFEFQLHSVGSVLAGMVIYPFDMASEVLRFYRDFSTTIPDEANTFAALLTASEGERAVGITVCYNGPQEIGEKVLKPLREFGPPLADQIRLLSYLELQTMTDDLFPRGRRYYWKASLMNRLSDNAIAVMVERFSAAPSPYTMIGLQQLGNAANRVDPHETAFSHREALYDFLMLSGWEDPSEADVNIRWTRELNTAMQPYLHGGIYVNAFTEDFKPGIRAAYRPDTYDKLVALKNKYDPTNFFRLNPNIKPTVESRRTR